MKATTEQLVSALRVLSVEIHSEDGVANAVVAEAADRMTLLANLVAQHVQKTKDDVEQMAVASETMVEATAKIQELRARIKHLEEWKESALAVEREWNANALATMLGGRPGESQREVIQREVPKVLARIKRLEAAVKAYQHVYTPDGHVAPHDCFATGPRLGDPIQDLIVCLGCWAEKKAKEAKP